jgi:UDP-glucuronate decarboxylase
MKLDIEVDQIYNFASPTAPGAYQADPQGTIEANTTGTKNMLDIATEQGATMLHTSSIRVDEETPEDSPHFCYIGSKRKSEELCREYHDKGTKVKVARLFNTYGPKMATNDSRVVPQFIMRALRGDPLMIVGDGLQKDSFCYVSDMLDGLIAYMNSDIDFGPVQFGYPEPISILDLAFLTIGLTDSKSQIIFNGVNRSAKEMAIKMRRPVPDITEAREKLGWEPKVPLEKGLPKLADYYSKILLPNKMDEYEYPWGRA